MTNQEKTTMAVVTGCVSLFFLIVGLGQGWPALVWLLFVLLPIAGAFALEKAVRQQREQRRMHDEWMRMPAPPPEPERPHQESLSNVSLRSSVPDYRFLLSGTVYWRPIAGAAINHGNPGALARDAVVQRAANLLANEHPDEHASLNERLNAVAGSPQPVASGEIEAWASGMTVTLPKADQDRLHRLAEVRKAEEVWEHERNHERNVREYLGEDVLRDPGRAVVWWLARHYEREDHGVKETVQSIDHLRELTSAAHDTTIPPRQRESQDTLFAWPHPGPVLSEYQIHTPGMDTGAPSPFPTRAQTTEHGPVAELAALVDGSTLDTDERTSFAERLSQILDAYAQHEVADALRRHYGEPDNDGPRDEQEPPTDS